MQANPTNPGADVESEITEGSPEVTSGPLVPSAATSALTAEPKPGYLTTEFWLTVSAALVAFLNNHFGWHIPPGEMATIVGTVASYVLSRGWAKSAKR